MRYLVSICLILVGIIHLLPLVGVLGPERLALLYGLDFSEPNLAILMRHRAVLFGLLGALLIAAGFLHHLRTAALTGGFVSVLGFLWLAWVTGGYNDAIAKIVLADVIATVLLLIALVGHAMHRRTRSATLFH